MSNRINELESKLAEWSKAYYENGESIVPDSVYDAHFNELKELNPNSKIFQTAGKGYVVQASEKEKFKHPIEVGSIDFRSHDLDEIIKKLDKDATWTIKIDGNSVCDYFENGKILNVSTRGSENIGIIRTDKFVECGKTPKQIDFLKDVRLACVRGEVAIPKKKFLAENGFDTEKASRNSVAGAITRKTDWKDVFQHVDNVKYTFVDCDTGENLYSENWEKYYPVERQKPVFVDGKAITLDELKIAVENSEYECDGIVFRNSDGELFAFKFEDAKATTQILKIDITIGAAQRLTPVANLLPVNLSGSLISKASLGSFAMAEAIGAFPLNSNCICEVVRSGEIIPLITRIISNDGDVIQNEILCPVCGTKAEYKGAHAFCVNQECPNIEREYLFKFCSFVAPEGLREKTLEKIFEYYGIVSVVDLVSFGTDEEFDVTEVDGIGNSASKLFEKMLETISSPINSKIIYQTFITGCGERASKAIVNSGFKFSNYFNYDGEYEKLESLPNFNSNIITEMMEKNELIEEVCSYLEIYDEKEIVGEKSFCITGVRLSKEQLEMAKNAGWEEKSGVSKNLNVLVVKSVSSTSSKTEKAKSLGVKIVSLDEFLRMIQN
jgi:DNA ligase (NAD+)